MARRIKTAHINPNQDWAERVVADLPEKEARRMVKWWRGKDAKNIWGTEGARHKRQAMRHALEIRYGK